MKTLVSSLILAGAISLNAFSNPTNPAKKAITQTDVSRRLSSYITYPASLPKTPNGSVVMIQFKVGTDNRLRQLAVLSPDTKLNDDLVRQLTGRKLAMANANPDQVHTIRVHFQTD
ncbi:MAG: hypothetical protein H7Z72_10710 [Bacteroidetes bacterium]|nr:hypothetical protein [Fibrella sp.]